LAFFPILCAIEVVVGGGGGVTYRWAIRWRIITLLYYIRTEDGDVLRCDVMADECDRFVDDSESISRGLVRTVVVWSVRGSVCSFTSLSLSLSFTLTPLRLSHWYFSILSPFAVNLYYYTHRIIIMSHTHTHHHKIYDFIYMQSWWSPPVCVFIDRCVILIIIIMIPIYV